MMSRIPAHFFDDEKNGKEDTDSCSSSMSKPSENAKSLIRKRISRPIEEPSEKEEIFEESDQGKQGLALQAQGCRVWPRCRDGGEARPALPGQRQQDRD